MPAIECKKCGWFHGDYDCSPDREEISDHAAELASLRASLAEAVKRATALEEGQRDLLAHLVAAVSLLKRTPKAKKAAPSNRMFDQMLADYEASIKRGRALAKHEGDGL